MQSLACNFFKKEIPTQVFSYEFYEITKFIITPFLLNTSGRLLLIFRCSVKLKLLPTWQKIDAFSSIFCSVNFARTNCFQRLADIARKCWHWFVLSMYTNQKVLESWAIFSQSAKTCQKTSSDQKIGKFYGTFWWKTISEEEYISDIFWKLFSFRD